MRTELKNGEYRLIYGTDKIEGLFIVVDRIDLKNIDGSLGKIQRTERRHNLTFQKIVEIAEQWGFDLSYEIDPDRALGSGCGGGCETCQRLGI